jgi:predicted nucleotidyltransferase
MLNIINKGYKKILELFYFSKFETIHLREIVKKTSMNENSVYRFLNKLEKKDILKSNKKGNMRLFSIRKNDNAYLTFAFFDNERYNKLPNIRKIAIQKYIQALPNIPVFIILFGSTAKNNFNKDSDVDLLIVTNEKINTEKAEHLADSQSAIKISTFQINYKNFLRELKVKEDKVLQSAIKTGFPLINHMLYYEVLFDEKL